MNDKIKITLQIAGFYYPLTIDRDDEEMVREAAKQVNKLLGVYKERYAALEPAKILPMVAYVFSLELLQWKNRNDTRPLTDKMKELTERLRLHLDGE